MKACICDACGKVQPLDHYGFPSQWIYVEQRDEPPTEIIGDDEVDFPRAKFEAACCSWPCIEELARRQQAEAETSATTE